MQAADWIKIYLGLYSRYSMEWSIQKQIRFGHNKPSFQKKIFKNIWQFLDNTYDILIFENEKIGRRVVTQNRAKAKSVYHQSKNHFQEKNCNF